MNSNKIEFSGKAGVVECDKFSKSVQLFKCVGDKGSYGKIEVKGKCNSMLIDGCQNVEVSIDTVMSTVEISNCKRIKLIMKPGATVLSLVIDKTDGCHIAMNKETQANPDFQVIAAKSSEMNLEFEDNKEKVERVSFCFFSSSCPTWLLAPVPTGPVGLLTPSLFSLAAHSRAVRVQDRPQRRQGENHLQRLGPLLGLSAADEGRRRAAPGRAGPSRARASTLAGL
jgi:hypothetical protein